jgi:dienelactone hydrolase
MRFLLIRLFFFCALLALPGKATDSTPLTNSELSLKKYFEHETEVLERACLSEIGNSEDWRKNRPRYREELFEMLGLEPRPEKSELKPTITKRFEGYGITVENLHFQSLPGLYVTANLYLPKERTNALPAILYVCGHASVFTNGVSYGNKTAYQHHAEWFARNGYACLVLDTIELGEISGIHHGTYREGMWWWNSRGYTPAGVEAWNGIRALDYLESRPEIDSSRIGITGRSGGGAYSWWIAALDDRIKAAAPVAGITDLHNHVVDGTVEGHCDCMFMVNTYRWDYPQVAALVAPRPLLICNSDKDSIFPLDGVCRVHRKVSEIYRLLNATNKLGLLITEGPHKDTQDLQLPVFRFFNRWLKDSDPIIDLAASSLFPRADLRVFENLPQDERTSRIHETFVATNKCSSRAQLTNTLRAKSFGGWPTGLLSPKLRLLSSELKDGKELQIYELNSQDYVDLRIYHLKLQNDSGKARLHVLNQNDYVSLIREFERENFNVAEDVQGIIEVRSTRLELKIDDNIYWFAPRGVGVTAWNSDKKHDTQIRRRFMLLGQTLDGMRVFDIIRCLEALRAEHRVGFRNLTISAHGSMGVNALYASLFEPVGTLDLGDLPATQNDGPDYLNVLRFTDLSEVLSLANIPH